MSRKVEKKVLFEIHGMKVREKSIYKVIGKPDKSAPSGFVRENVSKLPSSGVGESITCRFIEGKNGGEGLFDTGFYVGSPCYRNDSQEVISTTISTLKKNVVEPYEKVYGDMILNHKNAEFWDNYLVHLHQDRVFSTDNVSDVLDLYVALRSCALTPKKKLGNPLFLSSMYCVEDKEEVRSVYEERTSNLFDAINDFVVLQNTNRSGLFNILKYLNVNVSDAMSDDTLRAVFNRWAKDDDQNIERFQKTVDRYNNNEQDKEIINFYNIVQHLARTKLLDRKGGKYYHNGTLLGIDLKEVATNLVKDIELENIKSVFIEKYMNK